MSDDHKRSIAGKIKDTVKDKVAEKFGKTPDPLLEIRDLIVEFTVAGKQVPAVRGANLTVYPGQTVAIVGESGSGKSTTAAAVLGLLQGTGKVAGGQILFDGQDLAKASEKDFQQIRGSGIGLVPQDPNTNLNPLWRVGYQIRETLKANNADRGDAKKRAVELLDEAGMRDSDKRVNQYPHEYSGGMKQRALIAIGLAARPKLLIADEPTSALDVTVQRQILDHLETLTEDLGTAVLLITHDLGLAAERASHLVVMYKGRVVESGPAQEILQSPQHAYTKRLVAAAPSLNARREDAPSITDVVEQEKAEEAGADALAEKAGAASRAEGPAEVVVASHLVKDFPIRGSVPFQSTDFRAVDDVSFTMLRGTTTAIVGESGSGKSTVAQMVLGLLEPTSGTVEFDGVDVTTLRGADAKQFRRRVQPVFQNPYGSLDPMYSVYRAVSEPLAVHGIGSKDERVARVRELLEMVALPPDTMHRYPNELSGGQRQRVAIARALALNPEVVVLDEAVSALDVLVQAQILILLENLQKELGLTYLFITHDLAVVKQIAHQTIVMSRGKVVDSGPTDQVYDNPSSDYTRKLIDAIPGGSIELAAG
ncbi:ABC transporter related protein OS=Tsukamurella paurometabola (strain ATCC 8368 / DSM / CCUG 35730 / CIP 100753 / JCM 10117 / KCTC 9821 / NBRC 16120 / NCIMB 702349 / NCTC 13040) OX=521096 GN=Tpau_3912 PE=4 SV=1 [Tsukamurella paurometabola]|uniref:ABC transporter related protein n=1 Tax=Tsukamurella paurometabola (strain ATCC 8368 / DSM 20162 / CCUG 35730 / CIP 100753 / JCM 10117 / KCTC 9821 / NBRC 16120 / NCIMB 702349 / NCTC 13040) TaxID=521096 RepID=D5UML0_TSUPD|nr:ABC transporter ATP-binding protein [Tsukamurella paurometabola]ADG80484.1 ABC transporter related protein [Tsukamurella paurometabola DSM 20162]SUP39816.1 Glutathione import ATP-binding protein GsiA [Tsukamurella paurometabola]